MSTTADLPSSAERLFHETTGPVYDFRVQKLVADAVWKVDADDLIPFMQAAAGKPEVVNGVARIVPLQYPDLGGNLPLYCNRIEPTGFGHNQKAAPDGYYSHFRVKLHFETYPFALDGNQSYLSVDFEEGGRTINAPSSALWFPGAGNIHPPQDEGVVAAGFQFRITSYFLPSPLNLGLYTSLTRCSNLGTFLNMAEGTVLYLGMSGNSTQNIFGQITNTVTHSFHYSSVPWNHGILPGGTGFDLLTFTDGTYRYPLVDLTQLYG